MNSSISKLLDEIYDNGIETEATAIAEFLQHADHTHVIEFYFAKTVVDALQAIHDSGFTEGCNLKSLMACIYTIRTPDSESTE